jgi:hypothetical protein
MYCFANFLFYFSLQKKRIICEERGGGLCFGMHPPQPILSRDGCRVSHLQRSTGKPENQRAASLGPSGRETRGESGAGPDSRELTLTGLQAVTVLVEGVEPSSNTGTASRTDTGLFESSGRGFNPIKPIFPFYGVYRKPAVTSWLQRSSDTRQTK